MKNLPRSCGWISWLVNLLCLFGSSLAWAQTEPLTQEMQIRLEGQVGTEVVDDVDVTLEPSMRTDGWNPDVYLLELGVKYKPIDYFAVNASFRADIEERKSGSDHGYRPSASASGYLPLGDFEIEARFRYTHAFGPERDLERRFRYKGGLEYDVPRVKLDIALSAEAFQDVDTGDFYKVRYGIDTKYKFYGTKKFDQWIGLGYALDYYLNRPLNRHMPLLKYTAEF